MGHSEPKPKHLDSSWNRSNEPIKTNYDLCFAHAGQGTKTSSAAHIHFPFSAPVGHQM